MKDVTPTCEREFVKNLIKQNKRLDGRELDQSREIKIRFGVDRGCCLVSLGNTCVMSQVSCELASPRAARPSEGQLHLNVELSPMAAPNNDINRSSDIGIEQSRLLERCVRDSRCIDLENLCIVSGEKVWNIRVNVHILNQDGNLSECASIAAVASLAHFRRPDVTVLGTEVTVHSVEERDPVPLNMLHMPFATTITVFDQGESLVLDPTELEEHIADGNIVIAMNSHQELCMLHMGGHVSIIKDKILVCTLMASVRVKAICDAVKTALAADTTARAAKLKIGFAEKMHSGKRMGTKYVLQSNLLQTTINEKDNVTENTWADVKEVDLEPVFVQEPGIALLGEGGPSSWDMLEMEEPSVKNKDDRKKQNKEIKEEVISDGESSEEEMTMVLKGTDEIKKENVKQESRSWYPNNSW